MAPLLRRWIIFTAVAAVFLLFFHHLFNLSTFYPLPTFKPQPVGYSTGSETRPPANPPAVEPAFRWRDIPTLHPVTAFQPLPTESANKIPRIQHTFDEDEEEPADIKSERERRLGAVKEAFTHTWNGYKQHAWLHDEVAPLTGGARDTFGGWGATLVDTLDTLWVMGFVDEFEEAVAALGQIDFSHCELDNINVFETTIRYLGGFLSAHDLTEGKYEVLLEKAREVGDMLYKAFDTPNRMPQTRWAWEPASKGADQAAADNAIVAELGSLSMEFTRLSQITSDPKYYDAVQRIGDLFAKSQNETKIPGLWPLSVQPAAERFVDDTTFTFGGMADSTFEYLPKTHMLLGGLRPVWGSMHASAMEAAKKYLAFQPLVNPESSGPDDPEPLILGTVRTDGSGEFINLEPEGQHLTCFAGGMFALGSRALSTTRASAETDEDLEVARRLVQGCVWSYSATPTRIGPEIFRALPCRRGRDAVTRGEEPDHTGEHGNCTWDRARWLDAVHMPGAATPEAKEEHIAKLRFGEGLTTVNQPKYILRPEAIESLFVLYRITGDRRLQDQAWAMFQAVTALTRTEIAFAAMPDVMEEPPAAFSQDGAAEEGAEEKKVSLSDSMESFWTAETLKYYYLMFAEPHLVSLNEWVFNTEAHPFRYRAKSEAG